MSLLSDLTGMPDGPNGPTQQQLDAWPNCVVPDCPNKACLDLGSDKCHPHTTGKPFKAWDQP